MKRLWLLLLAASIGLNAALLWQHFTQPRPAGRASWHDRAPGDRGMRGMREPDRDGAPGRNGGAGHDMDGAPGNDAQPPYRRMLERRLEHMTRRLDLSDAQVERLRGIATSRFAELDSLRREARAQRGRIHDLLGAPRIDAGAVRTASARLSEINARIEARITENMIAEAGVLEPGQRARYLDMMRFGGPLGRGRRGRPAMPPPDDAP